MLLDNKYQTQSMAKTEVIRKLNGIFIEFTDKLIFIKCVPTFNNILLWSLQQEPLETISLNTQDQTVKYIHPAATVSNTSATLREQEILHVSKLNLTINPLFRHCTSPSPSKEPTKYSPSVNLLIKTSSHFSVKDIAFIDEDVSENSFCMVRWILPCKTIIV